MTEFYAWLAGLVVAWLLHRRQPSPGTRLGMMAFGLLLALAVAQWIIVWFVLRPLWYPGDPGIMPVAHAIITAVFNIARGALLVVLAIAFLRLFRERWLA